MSAPTDTSSSLPRVLGPWAAGAILVGCVIGTGVFKKASAVAEPVPGVYLESGIAIAAWVVVGLLTRSSLRVPRVSLVAVAAVGVADVSANALFAFASGHGLLALVAVLGSLYPVVTVLLAHLLLDERLTRAQQAGIAVALTGVCAIAAG